MTEPVDRLTIGLDADQRAELGDLGEVKRLLEADLEAIPAPDSARLLAALSKIPLAEAVSAHPAAISALTTARPARTTWCEIARWVRLARAQTSLLEPPFWWASALLLALGLVVGWSGGGAAGVALAFIISAPALAVGGVMYLFRPSSQGLWDLERISPTHPFELIYARLLIVLALNAVLALALLPFAQSQVALWRLVLAWLGPMIGLSGLALAISVRWNPWAGGIIPLGLWAALVMMGWREGVNRAIDLNMAAPTPWSNEQVFAHLLAQLAASNGLLVGALAALAVGIACYWLAGQWARYAA